MNTQTNQPEIRLPESLLPVPSTPFLGAAIRPPSGWQVINFRELWRFRELVYFLAWRDVKVRYKQTFLGAGWAVLQPLLLMAVFTIIFSRIAGVSSGDVPYPLFAYAGGLAWVFFSTAIANSGNSVVNSQNLITKVYFPRLAIPFAAVAAAAVDAVIAFALLLGMMAWYGVVPGVSLLLVPVIFALLALAAAGVGTLLAALNVAYRDFRYVIPFLVQLWMFATPTVYMQPNSESSGLLPTLLALNPLTGLIAAFRAACLDAPIDWVSLATSTACVAVVFFCGCLYFRRVEDNFADLI